VALAGCALQPPPVAPTLEPAPGAKVFPGPPERARYALAEILIGERNFRAKESGNSDMLRTAVRWVVGLIIGRGRELELQRPVSGVTDEAGRIFVTDASLRAVVVFDLPGKRILQWRNASEGQRFLAPVGIALDGAGGVLVTDSELGEVYHLDATGRPLGTIGGASLTRPTGIARDPASGAVYVADTARHDIKVFNPQGNLVEIIGNRGNQRGTFNVPTYLAFSRNRLYVADTMNFRVQVLDRAGNDRLVFGQIGLFVGNMTRPKGVAVGADGRIYVVESYYDHLLIFDDGGRLLLPIGGTGNAPGKFYLPSGVWTDSRQRVYVADMFNGRVMVFKELTSQ
jgi:DNA-binding beta-propeller fold protein YncE